MPLKFRNISTIIDQNKIYTIPEVSQLQKDYVDRLEVLIIEDKWKAVHDKVLDDYAVVNDGSGKYSLDPLPDKYRKGGNDSTATPNKSFDKRWLLLLLLLLPLFLKRKEKK